jgi:hypothetical protein
MDKKRKEVDEITERIKVGKVKLNLCNQRFLAFSEIPNYFLDTVNDI